MYNDLKISERFLNEDSYSEDFMEKSIVRGGWIFSPEIIKGISCTKIWFYRYSLYKMLYFFLNLEGDHMFINKLANKWNSF